MFDYTEIPIAIIKPRRNFRVTPESNDSRRNAGLITARKVHWPFQSNTYVRIPQMIVRRRVVEFDDTFGGMRHVPRNRAYYR